MTTEEKPLHIVSLEVSNVKRLRAVTIRPDGSLVLIGGRNAQGKSSLLDAIEMALRGKRSIPQEPIRHGTRKAKTVLDLGEITVERTYNQKGTELVVKGKDGIAKASPQTLLDKLCAAVAFDPLEFARMEADKQDALLKKLIGLDFTNLDQARQKLYDERAEANREVKRLEALLGELEWNASAPKELVDVAGLSAQLKAYNDAVGARIAASAPVERLRAQLAAKDEVIESLERQLELAKEWRAALATEVESREAALPAEPANPDGIRAALATAEETNAKVRANQEHARLERQVKEKADQAETSADAIASIDDEKAELLAGAKFPIEGLGFDESGPTFNGVPLAQASQAERLRLSVAIGAALNPRVKVMLIREGAFLDEESLKLLGKLAEETGSQIWVERVGTGDAAAIIIEDGSVLDVQSEVIDAQAMQ